MAISSLTRSLGRSAALASLAFGLSFGMSNSVLAQSKPVISVPEFKNETSYWWWNDGAASELADALSNELNATGNFRVAERQKLGEVLSEQELAELGITRPGTGAQSGQVTGAEYIVLGRVAAYEEGVAEESSGGRVGGIRIGGIRLGGGGRQEKQEAYIAIDVRVVDSTTGEVVHSRTVEGRATSEAKGGSANVGFRGINVGGDRAKSSKVPVGQALRAALIEASDYLSCAMVEQTSSCLAEYGEKDERRRENTRSVLDIQ